MWSKRRNIEHILRTCLAATLVWKEFPWMTDNELFSKPFIEWLQYNLNERINLGLKIGTLCLQIRFCGYGNGEMKCFNANIDIPFDQYSFIMRTVGFIKQAMNKDDLMLGKRKQGKVEVFVRWFKPREGWVKLNTDGAAKGNPGIARCGGLIRRIRGEPFNVFAANRASCSFIGGPVEA